jgi:hypothetical protein
MMNVTEHLMQCVAEECGEITQAAMKCTRFAMDGAYPDGRSNVYVLEQEYNDLLGVIELLQEQGMDINVRRDLINAKKIKVVRMMEIARERGALEPEGIFDLNKIEVSATKSQLFSNREAPKVFVEVSNKISGVSFSVSVPVGYGVEELDLQVSEGLGWKPLEIKG